MELVDAGRMPPWLGRGEGWRYDRRLDGDQKALLRSWFEGGAIIDRDDPEAVAITASSPASATAEEHVGTVMRAVDGSFVVPAESDPAWHQGEIDQRGNAIGLGNRIPWKVRGIEIETGAPQAVRVASMVFDDTGAGRYLDERDPRVGFLMAGDAGLVPSGAHGVVLGGGDRLLWPKGFHQPIPANADAVVEWHYRPTGMEETVQPRIRFKLLAPREAEVSRPLRWFPVAVGRVTVPAEEIQTVHSSMIEVPVEVDLVGITPRALEIATDIQLRAFPPGSSQEFEGDIVIEFASWDHHQRETVISETPRRFEAGTRFQATFRLDNRTENPSNPDSPAVDVRRGRRTGVLGIYLHLAAVQSAGDEVLVERAPAEIRGLMGRSPSR